MSLFRHILVVIPTEPEHRIQLREAAPQAEIRYAPIESLSKEELQSLDAVVGNIPPEFLPKLNGLKLLQLNYSGVGEGYLKLPEICPGALLCCSSGAYGQAISEHMLACLLSLMKRLNEYRDDQLDEIWTDRGTVRSLRGATVLVIGAGSIGGDFAALCQTLGAHTLGIRRNPDQPQAGVDEMFGLNELDRLLPLADVVALALPGTGETEQVMTPERIQRMKKGSYLLNVGRGSAINQEALLEALQDGTLLGAALDVMVPEPLPKGHPFWKQKNLILTPHISGFYHLRATHDRIISIACHNLRAFPQGPFISRVDYESGYRQITSSNGGK